MKYIVYGFVVATIFVNATDVYGFGKKKMNTSEIKGTTETQIAKDETGTKVHVMVRGKAAELFFKMIKEKHVEQNDTAALAMLKDAKHWTVNGKQITCSKVEKNNKEDFACAFDLADAGEAVAGVEPFTPSMFQLAKTSTPVKFFKNSKKEGRALASSTSPAVYSQANAYVVYEKSEKKTGSQDAMIVVRGDSAKEIIWFLTANKDSKAFKMGGAKGVKGKDIACVESVNGEPERCALVVSLLDGSVSTSKNPLF